MKRIYWILLFIASFAVAHYLNSGFHVASRNSTGICANSHPSGLLKKFYPVAKAIRPDSCPFRVISGGRGSQVFYHVRSCPDLDSALKGLTSMHIHVLQKISGKSWFVRFDYNAVPVDLYCDPDRNVLVFFISARTSSS